MYLTVIKHSKIDKKTIRSSDEGIPIPVEDLGDYFKSLLDDNTGNTYTTNQIKTNIQFLS